MHVHFHIRLLIKLYTIIQLETYIVIVNLQKVMIDE